MFHYLRRLRIHIYSAFIRPRMQAAAKGVLLDYPAAQLTGLSRVKVGCGTAFGRNVRLCTWGQGSITVGCHCHFGPDCHISAVNAIEIGDNLLTGSNVLIVDNNHGDTTPAQLALPPVERPIVSKGPVRIGHNVWLGQNVCILSGVSIGDGAVVGANSVVTHDVPPATVVSGAPVRPIKAHAE